MHDIVEARAGDLQETAEGHEAIGFVDLGSTAWTPPADDFPYLPDYPEALQFRIAVVGNAIDKIARDGDMLLCLRADAATAQPQDGDLVVIEVLDDGESRVAIRRLRRIGDVCEFRHESNDPAFQDAPLICDLRQDDGKVRILGKAVIACRRLGA